MAMTVSMARSLGLTRLAVPTQGNAGRLAGRIRRGGGDRGGHRDVARHRPAGARQGGGLCAGCIPDCVTLDLVAGTIIDCARRIREQYVPRGYFSVATFQEPGWRTEGKKTLGLEMAEPAGERLAERRLGIARRDRLSDRRRHRRRRHGQGVRRARGARPGRPRPPEDGLRAERGEHADRPRLRVAGTPTSSRSPPGRTIATGSERGAERRAHQRLADHPRDRRLRPGGLRRMRSPPRSATSGATGDSPGRPKARRPSPRCPSWPTAA